ncbi:hypothetical protein MW402_00460 (plasmid) [Escherichia coli]|uniref:hypothetical protein n=1 Tax=Escherichia coli TaxID=562 RepID=UPI0022828657|nr:hypothetical protein [Escherichia coli]WAH30251.1 hypothetical protein MW402_00460 [Escherichia coli]
MDIKRGMVDTPVKQHEKVSGEQAEHDVAREHGLDMREQSGRQNRNCTERVKSPSRGFFYGILNMASTEGKKLLYAPVIGEHLQHYRNGSKQKSWYADSLACGKGNSSDIRDVFLTVWPKNTVRDEVRNEVQKLDGAGLIGGSDSARIFRRLEESSHHSQTIEGQKRGCPEQRNLRQNHQQYRARSLNKQNTSTHP